jgi:hypothetical protein
MEIMRQAIEAFDMEKKAFEQLMIEEKAKLEAERSLFYAQKQELEDSGIKQAKILHLNVGGIR